MADARTAELEALVAELRTTVADLETQRDDAVEKAAFLDGKTRMLMRVADDRERQWEEERDELTARAMEQEARPPPQPLPSAAAQAASAVGGAAAAASDRLLQAAGFGAASFPPPVATDAPAPVGDACPFPLRSSRNAEEGTYHTFFAPPASHQKVSVTSRLESVVVMRVETSPAAEAVPALPAGHSLVAGSAAPLGSAMVHEVRLEGCNHVSPTVHMTSEGYVHVVHTNAGQTSHTVTL